MAETESFVIGNTNVPYFRYPYGYFLEKQKLLCVKTVVLWGSVPHIWIDQFGVEPVSVIEDTRTAGFEIAAFAARPYNYSLFADSETILHKYSMNYYYNTIDFASEKKIPLVGIDLWGALRDLDQTAQYRNCVEALCMLVDYAGKKKVKLYVGNVPYVNSAQMNTLEEVAKLSADVNDTRLQISLEYGMLNYQQESLMDWLEKFADRLAVIYVSDSIKNKIGFIPGTGELSIAEDLEKLRTEHYSGLIVPRLDRDLYEADPFPADQESMRFLNNKGMHIISG